jgi:hypothetical protein
MKSTILLATALILAAASAAAETITTKHDIRIVGEVMACRDLATIDLFESWVNAASRPRGGTARALPRLAVERWADAQGCEMWNGADSLVVVQVDPRNSDPRNRIKLCVSSGFIVGPPPPALISCFWVLGGRQTLTTTHRYE